MRLLIAAGTDLPTFLRPQLKPSLEPQQTTQPDDGGMNLIAVVTLSILIVFFLGGVIYFGYYKELEWIEKAKSLKTVLNGGRGGTYNKLTVLTKDDDVIADDEDDDV
jgi:hypothetical protein